MQDLNPGSQTPNRQQTECSLTNRLSYRGSSLKLGTRQPVPMISEHSSHLTPLSVDFRTWLRRYTYLLLLISVLWHRQAIFKSNGDKLCSSAECRIWTRGPRHQIASRLNARWQTDWAIEDQAKNLNSTASPYDQRAFIPLESTVSWLSHLALAIYIYIFYPSIHLSIHTYIHTYIHAHNQILDASKAFDCINHRNNFKTLVWVIGGIKIMYMSTSIKSKSITRARPSGKNMAIFDKTV